MSYTLETPQSAPTTSSLVHSAGESDDSPGGMNPLAWIRRQRQEADTLRYLDSLYERAKTSRWRFERQWYVNLSYYFGRQWITWLAGSSPDIAKLYEPQAPPWRVRLTVNRIKPAIRRELSKTMKQKPTAFVIPASTDDSGIAAARAGEAIFEHQWRTLDMETELWVAQFWRCATGTGFIKDWWDPRAKTDDGTGSVGIEVVTPFHLFFANLEQYRVDRQEHVIHVSMKSPEEVESMYGVKIKPDSIERGGGVIEAQYLRALNLEPGRISQVAVKEIWIKPNVKYPQGAMFVWAGGKILFTSMDPMTGSPRWPLYKMEYPFTKFDGVPTGRFYGDSSIIDLLPLQKEYNRTRSQIIEAKNQMAKPQLLASRGSIEANKITSEPGLVIFYTPGYEKPTPLPLQPLPNYVLQELDRSLMDMADISGQHEVSSGTVPPGVTAASALSFLSEQDDTMMAPIIKSLEAGVERLGRHILCHVHERWDEAHAVKVLGPDNTWEIKEFSKLDLGNNTDLNIQAGSAMPRSLAAKQAFIMELIKMRVISPEIGLRYLEMAETGQMYEETQVDRRQAERENMKMSDPSILEANFKGLFDNLMSQMGGDPSGGAGAGMDQTDSGGLGLDPSQPTPPELSVPPTGPMGDVGGLGAPTAPETTPQGALLSGMPPQPGMLGAPQPAMPPGMPGQPGQPGMPMDPSQGISPVQAGMPMPPPLPMVPVNTWDNHDVHIQVHNDFRKRQEFEALDPRLKEEIERHVELHRSALMLPPSINPEQAQQMVAMQQMTPQPPGLMPGAPPSDQGALPPGGDTSGGTPPPGQ